MESVLSTTETFRTFRHKDPTGSYRLELKGCDKAPEEVAELGQLVKLGGFVENDIYITLAFPKKSGALLLASDYGTLYVYDPQSGLTDIKTLVRIEYRVDKGDKEGECIYYHKFSKPCPSLIILTGSKGKLGRLSGGAYKIKEEGIVG